MHAMRPRARILGGAATTVGAIALGLVALLSSDQAASADPQRPPARAPENFTRALPEAGELRAAAALIPAGTDVGSLSPVASTAAALMPAPPGEPVTFTGRVLDDRGTPLPGARVLLVPDGRTLRARGRPLQRGSRVFASRPEDLTGTVSAEDGSFELVAQVVLRKPGEPNDAGNPSQSVLVVRAEGFADFGHACFDLPGGRYDAGELQLLAGASVAGRVVDERGWPLREARVVASVSNGVAAGRPPMDVETWLHTTTTGEDGRFRIDSLPGPAIELRLSGAGRAPLNLEAFEVQAGLVAQRGDLVMPSGGEVAGLVVDPRGQPLADARVAAVSVGLDMRGQSQELELALSQLRDRDEALVVRTDAEGRFRLGGLSGGNLSLVATADGFEAALVHDVAPFRRDVVLAVPPRAELLVRAVDRTTRAPVSGTLEARRRINWWSGPSEQPLLVAEPLAAPGEWRVTGAGPLGTSLKLSAPGYARATATVPGVPPAGHDTWVFELDRGADLSGVVRDGDGRPLHDAGLTLLRRQGDGSQPTGDRTRSDDQGRFTFAGLAAGAYLVRGEARGCVTGESADVLLEPGRPASELELLLQRAGLLEGRLLGADGRPAAGRSASARLLTGTLPRTMRNARADTAGRFVLRDLQPGTWEVSADPCATEQVLVEPGVAAHVELQHSPPGLLHGTVLAAGLPQPDVRISVWNDHRSASATSDERGRYELSLDAGAWHLRASSPEGGWLEAQVDLAADEQRTLDLLLPAGRLDVLAQSANGSPAAEAQLELVYLSPGGVVDEEADRRNIASRLRTGPDGHAVFAHLPPGTYWVEAAGGAWLGGAPVQADVGERPVSMTLEVRPAARISGRVVTPAGLPAPDGTTVQLYAAADERDARGGTTVRGGDGRFELTALEAGHYLLTAGADWTSVYDTASALAEAAVALEAGQSLEVVLAIH